MIAPACIECGERATLVGGNVIYPHRGDLFSKNFWLCGCGAYCGCHKGTSQSLGRPCGPDTRKARTLAHEAFDPLWKTGLLARSSAYMWLSQKIGIKRSKCHIGSMNKDEALMVVEICKARKFGMMDTPEHFTFRNRALVKKKRGSSWRGEVCGWYSTDHTPEGYNVNSAFEPGSVQCWPRDALEVWDGAE